MSPTGLDLGLTARLAELTKDDHAQHSSRLRLWNEFNRAWLTTLQRQYDLTEESLQSGRGLREPQSIMSAQTLERLAQELIKLCDNVERHGLVDYQIGAAEEEIIDRESDLRHELEYSIADALIVLLKCLELLDPNSERTSEVASAAGVLRGR